MDIWVNVLNLCPNKIFLNLRVGVSIGEGSTPDNKNQLDGRKFAHAHQSGNLERLLLLKQSGKIGSWHQDRERGSMVKDRLISFRVCGMITLRRLPMSGSLLTTEPTSVTSFTIRLAWAYVANALPPNMTTRGTTLFLSSGPISCHATAFPVWVAYFSFPSYTNVYNHDDGITKVHLE